MAILFRFGTSADHLTRPKNQSRGFRLPDPHYSGCKPLWLILDISPLKANFIKVEVGVEFRRGDDILELRKVALFVGYLSSCTSWLYHAIRRLLRL